MVGRDVLDDGQAEAGAAGGAGARGIYAVEGVEDAREIGLGDAGAGIGDTDGDFLAAAFGLEGDGAGGGGVLDGVAQEIGERAGEEFGIGRDEEIVGQDEAEIGGFDRFPAGRFGGEIVPVSTGAGELRHDEGVRPGLTMDELAAKRPAFRRGGTVTGGNSSPLNDGAACLLLASERALTGTAGAAPMARYVGTAAAGVHPDYMGIGPVPAMGKALARAGWRLEGLDLIEVNEAFAAQILANGKSLGWDWDRVNVNGGAIALGHPIGATGARIVVTLLHALQQRGVKRGMAGLCHGGGGAVAMSFELV